MTREQFDNYHFSINTIIIFKDKEYPIYSVEFDGVIGYKDIYNSDKIEYVDYNFVEVYNG